MLRKIYLIIFVFLLLMYSTTAINNEQQLNISTINCTGKYEVKVQIAKPITGVQYTLNGCSEIKNMTWSCDCINPNLVLLYDDTMKENLFDFIVQYYVEEVKPSDTNVNGTPGENDVYNDGIKRNEQFNKIIVNKGGAKPKFPKFTPSSGVMMFIGIGGALVFIILAVILAGIWIFKGEEKEIKTVTEKKKKDKTEDDDMKKYLEGLIK